MIYIDDPFVLDDLENKAEGMDHRSSLVRNLKLDDTTTNVLESLLLQKKINNILDKIKTLYTANLNLTDECAASVDAVWKAGNRIYLVEFKNGNMKECQKTVKDKIRDSMLIF